MIAPHSAPAPAAAPVKDLPENCLVGDILLPASVPHWDGRIRLVEFTPLNLAPEAPRWIFAASYKGMDVTGWKRIE
ncbi:hypothetical protein [Haloferula sp. BvORR071]|uniref:hypothetical protein n=1 Tax=Haloferula sp. BvORR071 TaxID=1396141 RepID=UPI002240ECDA|nr:hypothetical protein [Haloferula sp. BvORR071]